MQGWWALRILPQPARQPTVVSFLFFLSFFLSFFFFFCLGNIFAHRSLLNLDDSKPMSNWIIKATSQEAWAGPSSGISSGQFHRRMPLVLLTAEVLLRIENLLYCSDLHLLPRSLLCLSFAPSPHPPPLSTARKEEIKPHSPLLLPPQEHDRRFPTKTKVTQQSFLPGCCAGGHAGLLQLFLFYTNSLFQSLESLPTSWGEWPRTSKQTRLLLRRPWLASEAVSPPSQKHSVNVSPSFLIQNEGEKMQTIVTE